jgi:tetratricopeptide (TPR) repeat protein
LYNVQTDELLKLKIKLLSYTYFFKEDFKTAIQQIDNIEKEINLNNNISMLEKGKFYTLQSNIALIRYASNKNIYDEAIKISEKAEEILSGIDSPEAKEELFFLLVNNLMDFYNVKGDLKKAEDTAKKSELLVQYITHPTYIALYYFSRFYQLYNKGDYKEAHRHINLAINKFPSTDLPENFQLFIKILNTEILTRLGDLEKAVELHELNYNKFIKNYPHESKYKRLRVEVTRALIFLKKNNLVKSYQIIKPAIEGYDELYKKTDENPIQGFSHIILGEIYEGQNEFTKALEEYRKAEKIYTQIFKTIEVDDFSYLYKNLILLSAKMKDNLTTKRYLKLLIDNFGFDHPRTLELMNTLDDQDFKVL